jgi:ATP-dependent DNA helicase RecG
MRCSTLHHPGRDVSHRGAGRPQPPGLAAPEGRGAAGAAAQPVRRPSGARSPGAPVLRAAPGGLHEQAARGAALRADRRAAARGAPRSRADLTPATDAPPASGRRGFSGKTVVAALAAATAMDAGWQCALMAPTEILAEQHFRKLIGGLAWRRWASRVAWLTGSQKKQGSARPRCGEDRARRSDAGGGHARRDPGRRGLQAKLALAIVDEQHRFGVAQRLALRKKLAGRRTRPQARSWNRIC